jgi:hypothetical protein
MVAQHGAEREQASFSVRDGAPRRYVNHVELVHRPGERHLVARLFELLSCRVRDTGSKWLSVRADDPAGEDDLVFSCSEATPEQLRVEEVLRNSVAAEDLRAFEAKLRSNPGDFGHFGIRMSAHQQEEILERLARLQDPELQGRVEVVRVVRPEDPDVVVPTMVQAFVKTDLIALGLASLGQLIELQVVVEEQAPSAS